MGPKKATGSAPKKPSTHGTYKDMIKAAIVHLKDRMGSSRQAIKKYVKANNNLGSTTDAALSTHINSAIANGVKAGEFLQPKGTSGPVKLAKKGATATKSAPKKTTTAKKPAAKKATATKKAPAAKKAAAPKTKANVAKPRKAVAKKPAAAPAVEEKKPVVVGKTKSGRVTKTSAPAPAKKAAAKKATPKKKAAAAAA